MKKKVMAVLLSLCMMLTLVPVTAFAQLYLISLEAYPSQIELGETVYLDWTEDYGAAYYKVLVNGDTVATVYGTSYDYQPRSEGSYSFQIDVFAETNSGDIEYKGCSNKEFVEVKSDSRESYTPEIISDLSSSKKVSLGDYVTMSIIVSIPSQASTVYWTLYDAGQSGRGDDPIDSGKLTYPGTQTISSTFKPTSDDNGSQYIFELRYQGDSGTEYLHSNRCTLTVKDYSPETPYVTITQSSKTLAPGAAFSLKAKANTSDSGRLSYQWYYSKKSTFSSATKLKGETDYIYSGYAPSATGTYYYFCEVTNSRSGESVSDWAKVSIDVVGVTPVVPTSGSMNNFKTVNSYYNGMFIDVKATDWFASSVQNAYQLDLMKGYSANIFAPQGTFTVAEAIAAACRIHSIYYTGTSNFVQGSPWYQVYVNYALNNGIIRSGDFVNYTANCSRAQMAYIFSNCLPAAEFGAVKSVKYLPDVNVNTPYYNSIMALYNAGILTGNDAAGTFKPYNSITRAEVATIITRLALPNTRVR